MLARRTRKPWTPEELNAAGIPAQFHSQSNWWGSLEEMKEDLDL